MNFMKTQRYVSIYAAWFFLMMILGSVYTYSIYRPVIEELFQVNVTLSGIPYMLSLASYALSMYITGKALNVIALKRLIQLGGLLFIGAWMGASYSENFYVFTGFYGGVMGVAVGILYGSALQFVQQYAKQNVGFFMGLMLLGFGLSSVVLSPLASWVISEYSMATLFTGYAFTSALILIPFYVLYPADSPLKATVLNQKIPYLRLLLIFTLATMIGLTMIGLTNVIGVFEYGYPALNVAFAISGFALLNAFARPIFGWGVDRFGFPKMALASMGFMAIASLINLLNQGNSWVLFLMGYGLYWFNLGAWLALMPNYIKQKHGRDLYASIYGKVFLGYGISAIVGTLASSILLSLLGNSTSIYLLILGLIIGLGILIYQESTHAPLYFIPGKSDR